MKIFSLDYLKKGRIELWDFERGLAMLLVILQHANIPGRLYLLAFHMPLFFFISGYVSSYRLIGFGDYVKARFRRLIIPYLVFGLFDVVLHFLIDCFVQQEGYSIFRGVVGVLLCQFEPWGGIGVYWFLPTLFMACIFVWLLKKALRLLKCSKKAEWGGVLLFILLSYLSVHVMDFSLFAIDKSFMGAAFLLLGGLFKPYSIFLSDRFDKKNHWKCFLALFIAGFLVWLSVVLNSEKVLMYLNKYGDYGWFLLGSVSGIIFSILIGKYLYVFLRKENIIYRYLMWLGYNSLIFFIIHLEVKNLFTPLLSDIPLGMGVHGFLLLIAMVFVSVPLCNFVTRYLPWTLGQTSKKEKK